MSSPRHARALAAYRAGAWGAAIEDCRAVLAGDPRDVEALQLLGAALRAAGDLSCAEVALRRAVALAPHDAGVAVSLGEVLMARADNDNAHATFKAALALDPRSPWALLAMGKLLTLSGDLGAARDHLERALAEAPGHPHILAALATVAGKEGKDQECELLASQALAVAPQLGAAHLALAEARAKRGACEELIAALSPALATMPPAQRVHGLGLIARAYDKLGRCDLAFTAFAAANSIRADLGAAEHLAAHSTTSLASVERMTRFLAGADPQSWSGAAPTADQPVVLIGFPRSGTTLLEQAFASHPSIETLEERETIESALGPLAADEAALTRWPTLSVEEIEAYRAAYWLNVEACLGRPRARPVFLDKQPLAVAQLPLIHRIFPQAKIVFALRDPRDVVLSCFQQNFVLNPALAHFLTLEGAARYYDAAMGLCERARARLPLDLHVVRYETLVDDFEGEMRRAIAFLGLDWDPSVLRFADTAKARDIRTPSAEQVRGSLYKEARERWRRYRTALAPVLPILDDWAKAYGYPPA